MESVDWVLAPSDPACILAPGHYHDEVASDACELLTKLLFRACSNSKHGDDSADTDDDSSHCKGRAHLIDPDP